MEQAVTSGSGRSHKPRHTWCRRRFDPSFPFHLFLPLPVEKEDAGGQCLLQDNACVPTFLLFQPSPGAAAQLWPGSAPLSTSRVHPSCCVPKNAPRMRDSIPILDGVEDDNPQPPGAQPPPGDLLWHKVPEFLCPKNWWLEGWNILIFPRAQPQDLVHTNNSFKFHCIMNFNQPWPPSALIPLHHSTWEWAGG